MNNIHFDMPPKKSSIIKVLGIGGGGGNAVNSMLTQKTENVDFIICNTDKKALDQSKVPDKIQLGPLLTQGLGAGANPEVGKQATEESLEEIRSLLERDTKMAFITAGMGGGTGTGGAPIIAKICRELNILTVGIVTTPFGFEGPRRLKQAEDGIRKLQPYVDTLLVISNDKLRMQYGDLKLKEAFYKADNVLATAAKCITDIINSKGHINVDFADVCTVMKNGGVAILGSAVAEGDSRAQRAIEEALNSPLLNDNEIRGAKWVLININSTEGEYECTMDELEIISNYLRMQAGAETDVIMGTGYDATLDRKIGITLIATGFEHKDPFAKEEVTATTPIVKEEKIVLKLGVEGEEKKLYNQQHLPFEDKDPWAPRISEVAEAPKAPVFKEEGVATLKANAPEPQMVFELTVPQAAAKPKEAEQPKKPAPEPEPLLQIKYSEKPVETPVPVSKPLETQQFEIKQPESRPVETRPAALKSNFLAKPANIYTAEAQASAIGYTPTQKAAASFEHVPLVVNKPPIVKEEEAPKPVLKIQVDPEEPAELTLIMKEEAEPTPTNVQQPVYSANAVQDMGVEEDLRRKATERINKLRNISYNMSNGPEMNGDFEQVPAYVRRNMDLFGNTLASLDLYSKHAVGINNNGKNDKGVTDNNSKGSIGSRNAYLDGDKPD